MLRADLVGELDVEFDEEGAHVERLLPCGHALVRHLLDVTGLDDLAVRFNAECSSIEMLESEGESAERFQ